ncbi:MAG: AmmeMemoRadiSam system protein B [bacterium]
MSIVFAAITPHSPLLLPTIGKEHVNQLSATRIAFSQLAEDMYSHKIETLLIISPHCTVKNSAFLINQSPEFIANLEKFGDFTTKSNYQGDLGLTHEIREGLEVEAPLNLITMSELDYGSLIPLELLTMGLKPQIMPVYPSTGNLQDHFIFGQQLKNFLISSPKRIGIIASSDLSHKHAVSAPAGYSPKAQKFDYKVIELLQKKQTSDLLNLKPELLAEVAECGLRPISILLGILDKTNYSVQKLSYESPFGVGYLTMKFNI